MCKKLFLFVLAFSCTTILYAQHCYVFIGSYNSDKTKPGIYVYEMDTISGNLKEVFILKNILNPSFLTVSPDGKYLYACTETKTPNAGSVSSFEIDTKNGTLQFINSQKSMGENPVYVSVSNNGRWLINANYTGGSASVFPLQKDGSTSPAVQAIDYDDSSVNKIRQEHSHIHSAVFSPDGNYAFFPDLGADKIRMYKVDTLNLQPLQPAPDAFIKTLPGSGPRHICFHPYKPIAYCTEEMGGAVSVYNFKNGRLNRTQRCYTHTKYRKSNFVTADLHPSPDGKFLYVSNRGTENNIAIFSIQRNGKLKSIGYDSTYGNYPRNFAITPDGKFLIVANQVSGNMVVFKRNITTGLLYKTDVDVKIDNPSCVKIRQY